MLVELAWEAAEEVTSMPWLFGVLLPPIRLALCELGILLVLLG